MNFPKQIQEVIEGFERLPGIGSKTAERLAFYLLHGPEVENSKFAMAVQNLRNGLILCSICKNITDKEVCELCDDNQRDKTMVCVVESPLDVFALEKTGQYHGLYHVLHGVIDPLHGIGPEELYIDDLIKRIADSGKRIDEIILALNPTMEGEATAMYIAKQLKIKNLKLKISRLGMGMPTGGDIQYADETTLVRAMEGRRDYN